MCATERVPPDRRRSAVRRAGRGPRLASGRPASIGLATRPDATPSPGRQHIASGATGRGGGCEPRDVRRQHRRRSAEGAEAGRTPCPRSKGCRSLGRTPAATCTWTRQRSGSSTWCSGVYRMAQPTWSSGTTTCPRHSNGLEDAADALGAYPPARSLERPHRMAAQRRMPSRGRRGTCRTGAMAGATPLCWDGRRRAVRFMPERQTVIGGDAGGGACVGPGVLAHGTTPRAAPVESCRPHADESCRRSSV